MGSLYLLVFLIVSVRVSHADDVTQMGWPASLSEIYQKLESKQKNYLILISRLPTIVVDFRSENGLRNSINSVNFQKNFHPGHEIIGWKCRMGNTPFESVIGFSGESDNQHARLLNEGWGLSALLATFKDGFLQTPQELENRFNFFKEENDKALAAGKPAPISLMATVIEITEEDCSKVINEVYEYTSHPNNPLQNFSMILSPKNYEGAGCGSFVLHFMEQIESLKPTVELFRRQYSLPHYLFGTGKSLPNDVEIPKAISQLALKTPVSKLKLISSSWTKAPYNNVEVEIADPELIVFWQKLFFQAYFEKNRKRLQKRNFDKQFTRGIWPQPDFDSESSATGFVSIDTNYDLATKQLAARHLQMLQGTTMSYFKFSNFPLIILEKK